MTFLSRVLAVAAVIAGNAFFVAAEYALVTARRPLISDKAENGSRRARVALSLMDEPMRFLGTAQLGVTVLAILLGAVGEPFVAGVLKPLFGAGWLSQSLSATLSLVPAPVDVARMDRAGNRVSRRQPESLLHGRRHSLTMTLSPGMS